MGSLREGLARGNRIFFRMPRKGTLYAERSPWPGWVNAIFWGVVTLLCYAMLAGVDTDLPAGQRVIVAALIGGSSAAVHALLGGLTVQVREDSLLLHLGAVPLIRRTIPFSEIESFQAVRYHPIREFGGWGIRGAGKRKAWTARGDRAVALQLSGDRELLIGSDHPQRLEDRIRVAAGYRSLGPG